MCHVSVRHQTPADNDLIKWLAISPTPSCYCSILFRICQTCTYNLYIVPCLWGTGSGSFVRQIWEDDNAFKPLNRHKVLFYIHFLLTSIIELCFKGKMTIQLLEGKRTMNTVIFSRLFVVWFIHFFFPPCAIVNVWLCLLIQNIDFIWNIVELIILSHLNIFRELKDVAMLIFLEIQRLD